jgi:hypothetical protein
LGDRIVEDGREETRRSSVSATNSYPPLGSASAVVENYTKFGTADISLFKKKNNYMPKDPNANGGSDAES